MYPALPRHRFVSICILIPPVNKKTVLSRN
jgi:hypothetical protein